MLQIFISNRLLSQSEYILFHYWAVEWRPDSRKKGIVRPPFLVATKSRVVFHEELKR